jgi:hypothetical protein
MSFIPASKKMAEDFERIEALLANKVSGYSRNEILAALGWPETNANKQKLKRMLETLRQDPSSDVVAVKQNQEYGEADELPEGKHHITWKLRKTVINKQEIDAITLVTAKKYAAVFLPPQQRQWLEARYDDLYRKQSSVRFYEKWHEKIKIEPRYPAIYPKQGKNYPDIEKTIFNALMENTSFTARYDFSDERKTFYPVRLIRREQVLYVLCAHQQQDPIFKQYAIHRLLDVKESKAGLEDCFTKASYIDEHCENNVPGPWGEIDEIKLRITGASRFHFTEMRFHQAEELGYLTQIELEYDESDDVSDIKSVLLTIKNLYYTYEFRTWLLGFGSHVEVISPSTIRQDFKEEIKKMFLRYE